MSTSEIARTDSRAGTATGRGVRAASLRGFFPPVLVAQSRPLIALALLALVIAAPAPALAQCPAQWVPGPGVPGTNGTVNAVAILADGDVIVGGGFTAAGGGAANRIARFDPNTGVWSALGSGADSNFVNTLAVLSGGDVIAGGSFATAGGVAANGIARYNPSTGVWSALGSGVSGPLYSIRALAVLPDGDVIVGGEFSTAGGVPASRIARVNPNTGVWSALGSGINATAWDVAVLPGGDVIVGGEFTTAGGVAASRIARVNPDTGVWSALGSGANGTVWGLAVTPGWGDVMVGGQFTTAGGVAASRIASFNPTTGTWSALGSGTDNTVNALKFLPGGDLIVGGLFSTAGGVAASRLAHYNSTTGIWSALGSGVNAEVRELAVLPGGDVMVGGLFTTAGGTAAGRIARYTFGSPAPSIGTQPSPQSTCPSGTATFSITASGTVPLTYQWRKGGVAIDSSAGAGGNPSAATATLTLMNVQLADSDVYDCIVTNSCGSVTGDSATLTVCRLDYNCEGVVNPDDIGDFITDYFTDPPIPGPGGYAIPCPENAPPYDAGYKAAYVPGGSGQCIPPFSDNVGDWITAYFNTEPGVCP